MVQITAYKLKSNGKDSPFESLTAGSSLIEDRFNETPIQPPEALPKWNTLATNCSCHMHVRHVYFLRII